MTLEQLAGQVLWCGWSETSTDPAVTTASGLNDHARWLLEDIEVGGIVLFPRNLGGAHEIAALVAELRRHGAGAPIIGVDQEGGRVARIALPGVTFPGNMALGVIDEPETTQAVHRALGEQLAALGIEVAFSPSLDVNNNPRNPVIGIRSFGECPEQVTRHGLAAMSGLQQAGLLPVIKHFPGHGDTDVDSHLALPVQTATRERLDAVELVPFRAALAAGAPAVMTTHIIFKELDPVLPSTLSPRIIQGLLRDELGFQGLVVTDCLEMQGITAHWSPEETAVLALKAGADMLVACHTWELQRRMHDAICHAVRSGDLPEARLVEAAGRIAAARQITTTVREQSSRPELVGAPQYRALEQDVARRGLQLWETREPAFGTMPDGPAGWSRQEPVTVSGAEMTSLKLAGILREHGFTVETLAPEAVTPERLRSASQLVWVVLPDEPFAGPTPPPIGEALASHPRAVTVACREPYVLDRYPGALRVAAWGPMTPNLEAVAAWLAGEGA